MEIPSKRRPKKKKERAIFLTVRLTRTEKKAVSDAAKQGNISLSDFVRKSILASVVIESAIAN